MKKLDFTPKNVVNCVDNEITARINYYHWLSFFGSIVLYVSTVSYLCLSLIYCLTHVEWSVSVSSTWPLSLRHLNCTPRLQYMQRLFRLCHPFCEKQEFAAGFQHAFDLLATCFRHAHASRKPGLQLAGIMECGLNGSSL